MILNYKKYSLELIEISEAEFIKVFLQAEIKSKRFSDPILKAIKELNTNTEIITSPNINDTNENSLRKEILEYTRKFVSRRGLFEGFPNSVQWYRAEVNPEFLLNEIKYIDYDYWIELTDGSRLPKDAVRKIVNNEKVFNVPYDNFIEASEEFQKNGVFEEIIIVSDREQFVVLEGHLRLTVYALNENILPKKITLIIGISNDMKKWSNF